MKDMRMVYEQENERVALCKWANEQHSFDSVVESKKRPS